MDQTIEKYYTELCEAYDRGTWYYTKNSDRAHNAAIMLVMLEKAKDISMFCGQLSVFRKSFYRRINEQYPGSGQELLDHVATALSSFLKKEGNRLTILLENYSKKILTDLIISKDELIRSLAVDIYALPDYIGNKGSIYHVAFTEEERMVRLELDKTGHQAICKIGEKTETNYSPTVSFKRLLNRAEKVAI